MSGGRLRIKWLNEYGSGRDGIAEVNLIRDVSAGKADLGLAGTRVFDELGVAAFNPLPAPMLMGSYELEEKVLGDGLVDAMLASLDQVWTKSRAVGNVTTATIENLNKDNCQAGVRAIDATAIAAPSLPPDRIPGGRPGRSCGGCGGRPFDDKRAGAY